MPCAPAFTRRRAASGRSTTLLLALGDASPYAVDMAPRVHPGAAPEKPIVDESAAARERVRLAKWLVDQPESVRVGLDELAALDRPDEDDNPGGG